MKFFAVFPKMSAKGGILGMWQGITGSITRLPGNMDSAFSTLRWMGIGAVVLVGGSLLLISLSFVTGRQNIAEIMKSAR